MSKRLENKVALVTGAASGIGAAISSAFTTEGAKVVGADLQVQGVSSSFALFLKLDVTKGEEWEAAIKETVERFDRLDILVNCAGVLPPLQDQKPIWETDEKTWSFVTSVNATGTFLGCKYGAGQMIKQEPFETGDRGWIINLASVYGQVASPTTVAYAASKHACVGITRSAAMDCAPHRVHVNALCPGFVQSPLTADFFESPETAAFIDKLHPFRGRGKPEEVAKAAVFLASPDNTWMTGSLMTIDGGYTAQ